MRAQQAAFLVLSASQVILDKSLGDTVMVLVSKIYEEMNASKISFAETKYHLPLPQVLAFFLLCLPMRLYKASVILILEVQYPEFKKILMLSVACTC